VALAQVRAVAEAVSIAVIGMGGICNGADAAAFIAAGADLIAVGTENFRDPGAGSRIRAELAAEIERRGFGSLSELRGRGLREAPVNLKSR
jgi:dihydroorotate dehydrogenase (NAD+) catalytic subunit